MNTIRLIKEKVTINDEDFELAFHIVQNIFQSMQQ